jgi:CRISPR-associated exonuclease Cas4
MNRLRSHPPVPEGERVGRVRFTVTDIKQWVYCRRIPFYRYVVPVEVASTYPMERGKDVQAAVEALERRRVLRAYRLAEGERRFGVWLHSERLGLSGKLDLLIITPNACYPVDFKDTGGGVRRNHRVQLAAYALLAEDAFARPAPEGFIYLVPSKRVVSVILGEAERAEVRETMQGIGRMIAREEFPPATDVRARCTACEYRNFCRDIW